MTVVAALYDVHGNLPALDAVLADAAFARADAVVVGGDVAAGPLPAEVLDRLAGLDLPVRWVRGNADREVVAHFDRGDTDPSIYGPDAPAQRADAFTAARIARGHRDLMAGFEDVVRLDGALYCHGSPRSDEEIITALTPADRLAPMLAGVAGGAGRVRPHPSPVRAARGRAARRQRRQRGDALRGPGRRLLAAGRRRRARAARTEYDVEAAGAALRASGFPDVDDLIRESLLEPVDAAFVARHFEDRAGT